MNKNSKELITVVIPVFNVIDYLDRCIQSVLTQTYRLLQIVIVDDGSTDGSGDLCEKYLKIDCRVEVIHTANSGLSAARNTGLLHARGARVLFIDSDDAIGPNHIQNLLDGLSLCSDPSKSIVVTGFTHVSDVVNCVISPSVVNNTELIDASQAISESVTAGKRFGAHAWGKLYPRSLFDHLRYPVGRYYEDQFITYKLFLAASEIVYEDSNDYFYTVGRSASISAGSRIRELDYLEAIRTTYADVLNSCPEASPATAARYLASLIYGLETACLGLTSNEIRDSLYGEALLHKTEAFHNSILRKGVKVKYFFLGRNLTVFTLVLKVRNVITQHSLSRLISKLKKRLFKFSETKRLVDRYSCAIRRDDHPVSFLIMTPRYRNYGDQLIALSEHKLLRKAGIANIVEVPYEDCQVLGRHFSQLIRESDSIFFTGGGYLGDLWLGLENSSEKILGALGSKNPALFFPASVFYSDDEKPRFERSVENSEAQVLICAREAITFARLLKSFSCDAVKLLPDVGLFVRKSDLLDEIPIRIPRKALVCIRHDKESLQSGDFGVKLTAALQDCNMSIAAIDTHDPIGETAPDSRRAEIGELAKRFAEASLVVTNRLHGMVLAMIMGTPCVALDNVSGKVSGVARWVAGKYPLIISSEDEIIDAVKEASTFAPYDGDVADLLEDQRSALIKLIKEVAANE